MQLGTAGFTAAQCVASLQLNGVTPDRGEVLVTGATGGVASLAIKLLANLGYSVVALTGKLDRTDWLKSLGAQRIVGRGAVTNWPLRKSRSFPPAMLLELIPLAGQFWRRSSNRSPIGERSPAVEWRGGLN